MKVKNLLKRSVFLSIIIILTMVVISIIVKYEVEGEKALPYSIGKILLISTVDGEKVDDEENIWNINVSQINDIYIYVDKTNETETTIKQITLQNFTVNRNAQKGNLKIYRPTGELNNLYTYSEQNYLDDKIVYAGGSIDDLKSLEVSNVGGVLGFRIALEDLGSYISNENIEITYDGTLLSTLGISIQEIELDLSFDIIIETNENVSFKGTIKLNTPINTIIEEGSSNIELTDFSDVVFKRI